MRRSHRLGGKWPASAKGSQPGHGRRRGRAGARWRWIGGLKCHCRSLRALGLIVISAWLAGGCSAGKKIEVGGSCVLNSDCNQGLVCTWSKCHEACHKSVDCPAGQSCVQSNSGPVCQLPAEADCRSAACSGALICASDLQCRSGCVTAADCTNGQLCVGNVCADPGDLELNGQLPQKSPSLAWRRRRGRRWPGQLRSAEPGHGRCLVRAGQRLQPVPGVHHEQVPRRLPDNGGLPSGRELREDKWHDSLPVACGG